MDSSTPLCMVYTKLWELLESRESLRKLFKVGNRVRYDRDIRNPVKSQTLTGDLPEIRLVPTASEPHVLRTSNSSSLIKRFAWQILSGEQTVEEALSAEFEVYRAMANWQSELESLTWKGLKFVKVVRSVSGTNFVVREGQGDELSRDITGWVTVWECQVEMWFSSDTLKEG